LVEAGEGGIDEVLRRHDGSRAQLAYGKPRYVPELRRAPGKTAWTRRRLLASS
jgi:hypothetical protein